MSAFPRPDYRALSRYDPDRRPVAVDLSDNTNLWGTHPDALRVVREAGVDQLARYPALYADDLRSVIAGTLGVPPECVCTGCGSDDVLDAAWRASAEPGGVVRYAAPTFSMVEPLSLMNGREPRPVPWSRALDDPERLLDDDPALVYVCRPNNPTGELAPRDWLDALIDAAEGRAHGGPVVIVDEAYADFAGEGYARNAVDRARVLACRTMSKAYGLAGLRVGFGIGAREVVDEVEKARGPYKVNRVAAAAAAAALEDASGWAAETVRMTVENRDRLSAELADRRLDVLPSAANFLFLRVAPGSAGRKAHTLRERGVAVRPFPGQPDVGDGLRISVGPWEMMQAFLDSLDALLRQDPDDWTPPAVAEAGGPDREEAP